METGLLIALVFALAIIVLAIVATRLTSGTKRRDGCHDDPNGSDRDGDAAATWAGISRAGEDHHDGR